MKKYLLILGSVFSFFSASAQQNDFPIFIDNAIYVGLKEEYAQPLLAEEGQLSRKAFLAAFSEIIKDENLASLELPFYAAKGTDLQWVVRLSIHHTEGIEQLKQAFDAHAYTHYAERVPLFYLSHTPNDLGSNSNNNQWHLYKIKAQEAWEYSKGSRQVKVAIVDDAVQITHPDLTNNIWVNPGEIANNGIDDDQNGYIDDVNGYDVGGNDNDPMPNNNNFTHGTHTAGIAGATTNNNKGIASIGYNISLIPVKCTLPNQSSTTSIPRGYEGITYAAMAGADIISCSWGSTFSGNTGAQVVQFAQGKGAIIVAAMGNDNNEQLQYPASYSGVISVAATANNDTRSSYSNYHSTTIISAPGNYINSTVTNDKYGSQSGTSMATPLVAGLLALMKSHMLGIEVNDLKNCLINSADNIDVQNPNYAGKLGSGRINAEKSLQCVDNLKNVPPDIVFSLESSVFCPGSMVRFKAESGKGVIDSFYWEFPGGIPSFSTEAEPEIAFAGTGTQSFYLTVFNQYGSDKDSVINGISFSDQGTARALSSGFETALSGSIWTVNNDNPSFGWQDVNFISGADTNHAIKLNGYGSGKNGLVSRLTSEELDFSDYGNSHLSFNFAYARRSATANDSLFIEISTDTGASFIRIYGANLSNELNVSGSSNGAFTPVSNAQWCKDQGLCMNVSLKRFNRAPSVIIRITHYGASNGNNLYLDDLLVEGNCAVFNTKAAIAETSTKQIDACGPVSVDFIDNSANFPSSFHWYFPGGTPAESMDPDITVSYDQIGEYDVLLVVENVHGKDSMAWANKVRLHELPNVTVSASDTVFCAGTSVILTADGASEYEWSPLVAISSTKGKVITANPSSPTTYYVEGKDAYGCVNTAQITLQALATPQAPLIFRSGDRLYIAAQSGAGYQWYRDGIKIDGATSFEHTAIISGNYVVKITSLSSGCFSWSRGVVSVIFASIGELGEEGIRLYPNPANTSVVLEQNATIGEYRIFASDGRLVQVGETEENRLSLSTANWSPGIYLIQWGENDQLRSRKLLIQH